MECFSELSRTVSIHRNRRVVTVCDYYPVHSGDHLMQPLYPHVITVANGANVSSEFNQPTMRVVGVRIPAAITSTYFVIQVKLLPADATWFDVYTYFNDAADTFTQYHRIPIQASQYIPLNMPIQAYKIRLSMSNNEAAARTLHFLVER
jgi:hypothetical protein